MKNQKTQKYIGLILVIIVIILAGYALGKSKSKRDTVNIDNTELKDKVSVPETSSTQSQATTPTTKIIKPIVDAKTVILTDTQKTLLANLKKSADDRDFESFANYLEEVYKNQWGGIADFMKIESGLYVYAYNTYFMKGDLEKSLKASTTVYHKVPEAWRFRYLRILTLEKYGRNAFNADDLKTAESYASQIMQMMFRPEGADLYADIYIKKINSDIIAHNKLQAQNDLNYIWAYEVNADKRATLNDLKTKVDNM